MTTLDKSPEPGQELLDNPHIITEYFTFRVNAHIQQGMSARQANSAVVHQCFNDPSFIDSARNLEAYRARITEEQDGISAEVFTHAITVNPGQVLADASHWAKIQKQLEQLA